MLRFTFLLALLTALFSISGNVLAQSQTRLREIEPIKRPQLERPQFESPSEDVLDPMDPDNEVDEDESKLDSLLDDEEKEEDSDLDSDEDDPAKERLTDDRIRQNWPRNTISEIDLSLAEVGRVPEDRSELLEGYGRFGPVSESLKVFAWEAPNIRYQPLYFEDVALERYGQTLTDYRQGIRSAIIFGAQFTGWSLQLLETNPKSCDHPLGFCRPGTCVPQTTQRHFFGAFSLR